MRTVGLSFVVLTLAAAGCSSDAAYAPTGTGPAAKLYCNSSGKNAFDTFGATAFVAVNESIFTNVGAEIGAHAMTNLGDSFGKVGTGVPASTSDDGAAFKGTLAAFLVFVYGGPDSITYTDGVTYDGKGEDMVEAHTGLAITSAQYDYFVANIIVPALTTNGVTMDDVSSCFAPPITSAAFKASIVGH